VIRLDQDIPGVWHSEWVQVAQRVEVGILGPLTVRVDADHPAISGSRLRRLLLRLAVDAGSVVSAGELLDAVWPEDESRPEGATNALQSLISRLRRALADASAIQQLPGGYRLAVAKSDIDAHLFAELAARGRSELRAGDADAAMVTLESALALWRGAPLSDADAAPYAEAVVARLGQQRIQATGDLFDGYIALGRAADVVAQLEELATAEKFQEAFTGQLMTALAAAGRTAEALAVYERLRERLADELGVDPDPQLQAKHLALLRGEMPTATTPVTPAVPPGRPARRTNIRAALTSFIGRDVELYRIAELLDAGRLTTIIGPGGAGKTRLSAQAASAWQDRTADGVWMVELAPVTEAANIPLTMLSALGLRETAVLDRRTERAARDSVERLFEALEEADTLLVVDNCEHLIVAVAELVDTILARCPGVRVLATSREPLGIVGESLCVIPPLGLPPATASAAEAVGYPAVQLLAERAAAVSANFVVDESNVADIVEIVRRLDGLPLAIELAAARMRVLPVHEIALRLSDRFRLLTGGNRTAMPRHRTLRAVVEWSWDLLTAPERLLAERLSVFPAGATEDAANVICADPELPAESIPELLMSLVDKSLLQVVGSEPVRYRMLETIREYGIERLTDRNEAGSARDAHAHYFAALTERLEPELRARGQLVAISVLNEEQDNIAAALRFLGDSGQHDMAIQMVLALGWHWSMSGGHTESLAWMDFLLQLPGIEAQPALIYVKAFRALSRQFSGLADSADDEEQLRAEFAAIAAELEFAPPSRWPALAILGPTLSFFGGEEKHALQLSEALINSQDPWLRAAVRSLRASFAENVGDLEAMRVDVDAALVDYELIGDRWGLATVLNSRGWIRTLVGDLSGAVADYERALEYLGMLSGDGDDLLIHLRLSGLKLRMGDLVGARHSVEVARGEDMGAVHGMVRQVFADGVDVQILLSAGDYAGAMVIGDRLRAALSVQEPAAYMRGHLAALTLAVTAAVSLRVGDRQQTAQDLAVAFPLARETNDMPIVALVGVGTSGLAMLMGRSRDAAYMLGAAARLRGGDDFTEPTVAYLVGVLEQELGAGFNEAYGEGKLLSIDAALKSLDPAGLARAPSM
jgi:predicted ATPase/DNA-binding SARP family transcriptional activator